MKNYSHSIVTKIFIFLLAILCFSGVIKAFVDIEIIRNSDFSTVFEESYFHSKSYVQESEALISDLTTLIREYKSEEHILNGGTISEEELRMEEETLYYDFQAHSLRYNPEQSEAKNYEVFKEEYADKITSLRDQLIKGDLKQFHLLLQRVEEYKNPLFYASDGVNIYTNSPKGEKENFKSYPSYMIFEDYKRELFPKELEENEYLLSHLTYLNEMNQDSQVISIAFPEKFLQESIKEWEANKEAAERGLLIFIGFSLGFILIFIYLMLVTGRKFFKDEEVHLHALDKIYNDIKILLCLGLIMLWVVLLDAVPFQSMEIMVIPLTVPIATAGFVLILSLIRHLKNRTFMKHSFIYVVLSKFIAFIRNVYESGSVGVKTVLIVVGYPILVAVTFFIFPITIGFAAWFALKKIKAFQAIQEGVERIKDGEIHHSIEVDGKGEFSRLASNINRITDGLNKAVDNELKSERLKTELITNVSHDIRTPLTSIITYVDLLKQENDPVKMAEYIEVLEQKSKRLKVMTDDLFEAAKASSGNIPVQLEKIDIVSLINQGLGEVSDKIEASELTFKLNHPEEKVFMLADGRLLWRSIENVLSNIFKYALKGSRVYIDIENQGNEILLTFKNISAYELNISADELMERFTRGDESRLSEGSGLGLSITKSLIEIQKGRFLIQVDGDLFKAVIYMPKYK
ncbi:HAMP domain-containing sensor histidine kinase [Niallia endozanthoxylica]|uniref:HAMP domain-containing sensor histidine kinase n=1 Tax=Niallia endozanthoxylica TaxID=2036016 RepID=UPI001CC4A36E|nr:histidine kinase dimerization/phospho-acceptor domain-containing protein [Niallia endozanthoxylica]